VPLLTSRPASGAWRLAPGAWRLAPRACPSPRSSALSPQYYDGLQLS